MKCKVCNKNQTENAYHPICDQCEKTSKYTDHIGLIRMWNNDESCEVSYKEQREDTIESVYNSWTDQNTLGVSEKVTLSKSDIAHLENGGLILVAIGGEEYGLVICLDVNDE